MNTTAPTPPQQDAPPWQAPALPTGEPSRPDLHHFRESAARNQIGKPRAPIVFWESQANAVSAAAEEGFQGKPSGFLWCRGVGVRQRTLTKEKTKLLAENPRLRRRSILAASVVRDRRRRGGMTLIEIMVAIAVFAVVSTMVFGGLSQTVRNKQAVQDASDHSQVIRMAMERMVREFAAAYVSIHRNQVNPALDVMRTAFHARRAGGNTRIDFTSFSHRRLYRDAHESDQCELGYFVANHPTETGRKVLVRREQRRPDDRPEEGGQNTMLVEDVKEFELEFFDPRSQEWIETWDADGTEQNRLPAQVRIRLVVPQLLNRQREEVYQTRAAIPIQWALNFSVYI